MAPKQELLEGDKPLIPSPLPSSWLAVHPFVSKNQVDLARRAYVRIFQIQAYYPLLGVYYTTEPEWEVGRLWATSGKKEGDKLSKGLLAGLISYANEREVMPALSINLVEVQPEFAERNFSESIVGEKPKNPQKNMEQALILEPKSGSRFSCHLANQVEALLETYDVDLFVDRCDYSRIYGEDFLHSCVQMLDRLHQICWRKGKRLIANVPSHKSFCDVADIVTADCTPSQMRGYRRITDKPLYLMNLIYQPISIEKWLDHCRRVKANPGFRSIDNGGHKDSEIAQKIADYHNQNLYI